ncbi:MAG: copper-transporting ATPase, partial [Thermocrispum agreste]
MPSDSIWLFTAAVVAYFVVLLVPGLAVGLTAGLRGWTLAGLAPLFGYTVHGLTGPWMAGLDIPFTIWTALAGTVLFAAVVYAIRRFVESRWPERERPAQGLLPNWGRNAHLGVAACIGIAFVVSSVVLIAAAEGELDAIPQRWDPVFHANGIRYIAETGDGGLYGVSSVNRYGPEGSQFYPNAYHLAGSLVYLITGGSVPLVMTAMVMPLGGIFALSMAALVRECGGRAVLAGSTAVVSAVAASGVYESISNGLLPFALSVALTPLGPLAVLRFVNRPGADTGVVLGLVCAGMLAVHSSALFAIVLLSLPLLVHRWWKQRGTAWPDIKRLLIVAVPTILLTAPHLLGALDQASGSYGYRPWASAQPVWGALYNLLAFQHARPEPQLVLTVLVVVGLIGYRRLGALRWIGGAALLFGVFWLLVASFGGVDWVAAISRPWWN